MAGVIAAAKENKEIGVIYGDRNGIQGILKENLVNLSEIFADDDKILALEGTPSMYLGSCRYKMKKPEQDSTDYDRLCELFKKYNIGYFFYIGGNDSMDTVLRLSSYAKEKNLDVKVVGVPKTIDNDLECIDHTPGFGSAAKYIATSILEMTHDTYIYDMETVLVVEIMGRNAGWLTASSVLARQAGISALDIICFPEAKRLGEKAVELALAGESGVMATLTRVSNTPYTVTYGSGDIHKIANQEKKIPKDMISEDGFDVTEKMVNYLTPLIQGEMDVRYVNGLPQYLL